MNSPAANKLIVAAALLVFLPTLSVAFAKDENDEKASSRKLVTVPAGQVIDKDFFAFGEVVEISGTINGDLYAVAGQILVDGTVKGDLLAVGGTVTISGTVAQDARLAGGQITISGDMGRNLTVGGGNIELTPSASIHGGVVAGGGNIQLAAPVSHDVKIAAGNLTISNRIGGDVDAIVGRVRLTSKAAVTGNLTYQSPAFASVDDLAKISGSVTRKEFPRDSLPSAKAILGLLAGLKLLLLAMSFVSTLVLGFLLMHFYPNSTQKAVDQLRQRPMASLGLGLLALIGPPLLAGLLALTIVGLPLALVALAWYFVVLYLSRVVVIAWAGQAIFQRLGKADRKRWAFVVGLVAYFLLALIPVLGGLVTLIVILFGLGALLFTKKETYVAARGQAMV